MTGTAPSNELATDLHTFLRAPGQRGVSGWRTWARTLVDGQDLDAGDLRELWNVILAFDQALALRVRQPVPLPDPAVIVAGSGKESFKTFNVSTAAAILAAAAGARVVKGVSASVSAVSGSADILSVLGVPTVGDPEDIPRELDRRGLAFVPYAAFCPVYADRYDGVFSSLTPFSFFVPASVLAVQATAFVYGVADTRVGLAARAIAAARPDVPRGTVVSTVLGPGAVMDERAPFGLHHRADLDERRVVTSVIRQPTMPGAWAVSVRHRSDHCANACRVVAALAPDGPAGCRASAQLVELNAALILWEYHARRLPETDALARVRSARQEGRAAALLRALQGQPEGATRRAH
ncbi:hypothetical protein [Streptomyces sp. URMC 125]|uniref:hypothetical protein n=1 Tax=Streptomyces sp. URMC 125 TaxID=3423419 RepID=UPI003F1E348A